MTTEADLNRLIVDKVREGRAVEYKLELPGNTDSDKREFLADISSFANTSGGDIYFGVREEDGLPVELVGLDVPDPDALTQRLENMIRDGLEPRILPPRYHLVELGHSRAVLMVTIPRSWASPHAVRATSKFWARNSAGKYPLDVSELRREFLASGLLIERMRTFRRDRVSRIEAGESPLGRSNAAKSVLHLIPLQSFASTTLPTLSSDLIEKPGFPLIPGDANDLRHNFDGLIHSAIDHASGNLFAYTQVFRDGCFEAVDTNLFSQERKILYGGPFEERVSNVLRFYLGILERAGVQLPVYVALTLLGVEGYGIFPRNEHNYRTLGSAIDRPELLIPETAVEDYGVNPRSTLQPLFDIVWNAAGWPGSPIQPGRH